MFFHFFTVYKNLANVSENLLFYVVVNLISYHLRYVKSYLTNFFYCEIKVYREKFSFRKQRIIIVKTRILMKLMEKTVYPITNMYVKG